MLMEAEDSGLSLAYYVYQMLVATIAQLLHAGGTEMNRRGLSERDK